MMRYFIRHHPDAAALVLSVDERWCGHDPSLPVVFPFPFWLYRGDLEYLAHLLSTRAFATAQNRIRLAMGLATPTDPRGYMDYETGRVWNFHPGNEVDAGADVPASRADTYFPALEAFDGVLAELSPQTALVVVMPPVYHGMLPHPGTQTAADLPTCKAELARRLVGRRHSGFLDYLVDGPISRDPNNFMDREHYRLNIARLIEARVASVLDGGIRTGTVDR